MQSFVSGCVEDLAYEYRDRRGHYWLNRWSYLLSAGYRYHQRQRSRKPTAHCQ